MPFDQLHLHPIITRNLGLIGYAEPRPIQAQAIPPILDGRDVIGLAQTGTGKTAAFIAPLAHHLISRRPQPKGKPIDPPTRLRALVLCPTRELAVQVADEAAAITQGSVLRTACAYGKVSLSPQAKAIARGVDMLIATPGRVRELLEAGALSLAYIRHIAIDEADRMLDMGFLPQVRLILQTIPPHPQTLLFTATMPPEVEELASAFLNDPVRIEVGRHSTPVSHVQQHLVPVDDRDKVSLLLHLLAQDRRTGVLVFCRTRRRVGWVGTALERNGIKVGMLHGDRSQAQRQRALDRFANKELQVLVATDVAARGLHIPTVRTVINYDVPHPPEEYVHRIGRAGHGGGFGESFTFLSEDDRLHWRAILDSLGIEVYAEDVPGFTPTVEMRRGKRGRSTTTTAASDRAGVSKRGGKAVAGRKRAFQPKRSKKSRPIKKSQKPGRGVRRLDDRASA